MGKLLLYGIERDLLDASNEYVISRKDITKI